MSREIKFRGYDKIIKKVFDVVSISNTTKTLSLERGDVFYSIVGFDEVELMQYTGLKDKNGVDVFESDIVHIFNEEFEIDSKEVVMFEKGCFCLDNGTKLFECAEICEVIGNIYKDKELLN